MSCCPDCPRMDATCMPEGWKPRAVCCIAGYEREASGGLCAEELRSVLRAEQGPGNRASRRLNSSNKNRKKR